MSREWIGNCSELTITVPNPASDGQPLWQTEWKNHTHEGIFHRRNVTTGRMRPQANVAVASRGVRPAPTLPPARRRN